MIYLFWLAIFCGTAFAQELTPSREIVFKTFEEGESLKLRIFEPEEHQSNTRTPAILFFFGGGWQKSNPQQFYRMSDAFAKRGMVAICADYRTETSHGAIPFECLEDAKSAIRWVREHSKELAIDPQKLAVGGGSAGAHLAVAAATVDGFNDKEDNLETNAVPDALVLLNPVFDNSPDGYGQERIGERWREFSPLHNIRQGMPPAIVLLGDKDDLVPVATALSFQKKMKDLGLRSELRIYEGQGHGFFNQIKFQESLEEIDQFLVSIGYLEPKED